jgi:CheY-like chemotaxis protein
MGLYDTQEKDKTVILLALGKPEEALLFEQHLIQHFGTGLEIYRAPSGFDAMSLAMNRPRVVLLDQRLPDVMGLDMIEPIREQIGDNNYLIFVGGSGKGGIRPGMRDEALKRGATALFDRPVNLDLLIDTLHKLLYPKPPEHPHLNGLEMIDLLQAYHNKRVDRTLRIFAPDGRVGSLYMMSGEVTHIECGAQQGFQAMIELMNWKEGEIRIWDACLSSERTNKLPTQNLILDAAREMDEGTNNSMGSSDLGGGSLFGDSFEESLSSDDIKINALDDEMD